MTIKRIIPRAISHAFSKAKGYLLPGKFKNRDVQAVAAKGQVSLSRQSLDVKNTPILERSASVGQGKTDVSSVAQKKEQSLKNADIERVVSHPQQGMPEEHVKSFFNVASLRDEIIMVRPVDPICKTLIKEQHASKGFDVKGKSSDWGPHAGFIPANQAYCKHAGNDEFNAQKYQKQVDKTIGKGIVVAKDLVLSEARLNELVESKKVVPQTDVLTGTVKCCSVSNYGHEENFLLRKEVDGWHVSYENGEALKVLADPEHGKLTADYDLLIVAPRMEKLNLSGDDRLPIPTVSHEEVNRRAMHYKQSSREKIGLDTAESIEDFYAPELEHLGNITPRIKSAMDALNKDMKLPPGKNMVHHNADSGSMATDMSANFPCSVFFPQKVPGYGWGAVIETADDFKALLQVLLDEKFAVPKNPLWKMGMVRSSSYNEALNLLEKESAKLSSRIGSQSTNVSDSEGEG